MLTRNFRPPPPNWNFRLFSRVRVAADLTLHTATRSSTLTFSTFPSRASQADLPTFSSKILQKMTFQKSSPFNLAAKWNGWAGCDCRCGSFGLQSNTCANETLCLCCQSLSQGSLAAQSNTSELKANPCRIGTGKHRRGRSKIEKVEKSKSRAQSRGSDFLDFLKKSSEPDTRGLDFWTF